ncbi:MAG: hypothetical protein D6712_08640, partial [Chloroflexi bacterium]
GSGNDNITGTDATSTWNINSGADSYAASGQTLTFNAIEDITTGTGDNTLIFSNGATIAGSLTAQGGNDTLDLSVYTTAIDAQLTGLGTSGGFAGTLNGGSIIGGGFDSVDNIIAGSNNADTLTGLPAANAIWDIDGTNTYTSTNTLGFDSFELLNGGNQSDDFTITGTQPVTLNGNGGDDTFTFNDGAGITGAVDGGSGNNTLDYSPNTGAINVQLTGLGSITGFAGTESSISGGFDNVTAIIGSSNVNDQLHGLDQTSTWTVDGVANQYVSTNTLDFSAIEDLFGGSAADIFNIDGTPTNNLNGGAGTDTFVFNDDLTNLNGTINGGADIDTLDYSALTNTITVDLSTGSASGVSSGANNSVSNVENVIGGSGDDNITGTNGVNVLDGGAGNDTINGLNGDDTIIGGAGDDNLFGGNGNDTYSYNDGWGNDIITDNVGAGSDTLDLSALTVPVNYEFQVGQTIIRDATAPTTNTITYTTPIETITGTPADDTFVFADGAVIPVTIDALSGNDTVDLRQYSEPIAVVLTALGNIDGFNGQITKISDGSTVMGGFNNLDVIIGSGQVGDTITSQVTTDGVWVFVDENPGANPGDQPVAPSNYANSGHDMDFVNFEELNGSDGRDTFNITGTAQEADLNGGNGDDTFIFADGAALPNSTIDAGAGVDTLDYSAYTTSVLVDLITGTATNVNGTAAGSISNFENITGGSAADTLTGDNGANVITGNDGADNITGNDGADTIFGNDGDDTINAGAGDDQITGGAGNDTMEGGADDDTFIFADGWGTNDTVTDSAGNDTFNFSAVTVNLQAIIGTLTVTDGTNTCGVDNCVQHLGNAIENLIGSTTADDNVIWNDGTTLAGDVDLLGGTNTLDFSAFTTDVTFTLTGAGSMGGFNGTAIGAGGTGLGGSFYNVDILLGGTTGNDTLNGLPTGDSTWNINLGQNQYSNGGNNLFFDNIENMVGGADNDSFIFADGADNSGGQIEGGAGNNTLDYSAYTAPLDIKLTTVGSQVGYNGNTQNSGLLVNTFLNINNIIGGVNFDTLTGPETDNTWTIDGNDSGSLNNLLTFSNIPNLVGGTLYDHFIMEPTGRLFGSVNGNGGGDLIDYTSYTTDVVINLLPSSGLATNITGGVQGIDNASTGSGNDTLTGNSANNTLNGGPGIDTADYKDTPNGINVNLNTGIATGIDIGTDTLISIENVIGGFGDDTIIGDANDNRLTGGPGADYIDAGGGNDTLDEFWALINPDWTLTFGDPDLFIDLNITTPYVTNGTAGSVNNTETILNFENVRGGNGNDTIYGDNNDNIITGGLGNDVLEGRGGTDTLDESWSPYDLFIDLPNQIMTGIGNDTISGFENAYSGSGNDILIGTAGNNVLGAGTGTNTVTGGGGVDTIDESNVTEGLTFDLANNTITGPTTNTTLIGNFQSFLSGDGDDTFIFADGFTISGIIDGGRGNDTLDYSAYTTGITVNLLTGTATGVGGGISNIESAIGGSGNDMFVGAPGFNSFDGGPGNDVAQNIECGSDSVVNIESVFCNLLPTTPAPTTAPVFFGTPPVLQLPELGAVPVTTVRGVVYLVDAYRLVGLQPLIPTMLVLDELPEGTTGLRVTTGDFALVSPGYRSLRSAESGFRLDVMGDWFRSLAMTLFNANGENLAALLQNTYRVVSTLDRNFYAAIHRVYESMLSDLPEDYAFISGMTVEVYSNGDMLAELSDGATVTVSFVIPATYMNADLVILWWDAEAGEWVEMATTHTDFEEMQFTLQEIPLYVRYWDESLNNGRGGWQNEYDEYLSADSSMKRGLDAYGLREYVSADGTTYHAYAISGRLATTTEHTGTFILVHREEE